MPRRITIPFVGEESKSRTISVSHQETNNLIAAVKGSGSKAPIVLESAPGATILGALGNGAIRTRQMLPSKVSGTNQLYGVWGTELVSLGANDVAMTIGNLLTSSGQVQLARGRNYLMMVDGSYGYTYDGTDFVQITDLDFPSTAGSVTHCAYKDGFFIVNDASTDNWYISALEDPTSWNALDLDAAAVAPDAALAIATTESFVWVIGDETAQPYYNDGNSDFPFDVALSGVQEVGILAVHSIAESDSGIFYLATTPEGGRFVYRIRGQSGEIVSKDEQEHFLTTLEDPTTAYGFIYNQAGKSFYVLQCGANTGDDRQDSTTLVYNIKAGTWERRSSADGSAWRAGGHGILNNRNIIGSRSASTFYELDLTVYLDGGEPLIRTRRTQIYHNNDDLMEWWEIVVDVDNGVGLGDGSGEAENPMLQMRYSDDGGKSWGYWLEAPIGKIGETRERVVFRNLGMARARVFEIRVSDPVAFTIIKASAVVQVLGD